MSLRVEPDLIGEHAKEREFAYVLTVANGRSHAVAHRVTIDGATVTVVTASESTLQRIGTDSSVTLLWPPAQGVDSDHADYSLIADGTGSSHDGVLTVVVTSAILHRPAP